MGLFHDKCPQCGNIVSKRARFCSKCGRGAPGGWTRCPACGKWVGNDSVHCPACNHPLHPDERVDISGGVWDREPGMFAQRFELADVSRVAKNGLMIQEGSLAILLDGGKAAGILAPGRHAPDGFLRKLNWFGNPPPRTAVMVDAGDVVFRVNFDAVESADGTTVPLRSAEELPVKASAEITVRFDSAKADDFLANFMKDSRAVSSEDFIKWLYAEAVSAVKDMCLQSKIEDLVKDPDRRERFEEAISSALSAPMERCGLMLVRAGAVEFYGKAYEELRAKYGELDESRRLFEYRKETLKLLAEQELAEIEDARLHETRADDVQMERAKRARDTEEYLKQIAQEKQISDIDRDKEMKLVAMAAQGEVDCEKARQEAARALEEHAKAMTALANRLELDLASRNYNREQLLADADNQAKLSAIKRKELQLDADTRLYIAQRENDAKKSGVDVEIYEADKWLEIRRKKNQIKNEELAARGEILKGRSVLEMAALIDDPAMRAEVLAFAKEKDAGDREMRKVELQSKMTPEQLLAFNAALSPNVADAIARKAEAEAGAKGASALAEELKKIMTANREHDEKTIAQMAAIAKASVEHQNTTVVPPAPQNIIHN